MTLRIPETLYEDKLKVEDANFVNAVWPLRGFTESEAELKIQNFPSVCLREKNDGKIVSFEIMDFCGMQNHLYTVPEYRNTGKA